MKDRGKKNRYAGIVLVTVLSLIVALAVPATVGQGGSSDYTVYASHPNTVIQKKSHSELKHKKSRTELKQEIKEKTIKPESGQRHDGYIVIAKADLKDDAEDAGYTASASGDYIKVDEPADALDFTDPSLVDSIIPNIAVHTADYPYTTTDSYWSSQWNLYPYANVITTVSGITTSHGIGVSALYRRGLTGNGVKVGIFDTGFLYAANAPHGDLRKNYTALNGINFATMAGETGPNGEPGPSDAYESYIPYESGKTSYISTHGTAVAGFISAIANNGKGIAGVADGAEIYPYRMFNQGEASLYTMFYGLEYLLDNNQLPDVINMSIGSDSDEFVSIHLRELFDEVAAKGTIVVAAASNDGGILGTPDFLSYPASFDSVISVANGMQSGALSSSSQENAKVDVTAPGTGVYSLTPEGAAGYVGGGTSFASPLVAGIAAAVKQKDSSIDVYAFRDLIKKTSRKIRVGTLAFDYDANGHSDSYGYGLIDAEAMLSYLEQPGLYRIKYDLGGGELDKSGTPVCFATSGAFSDGIALPVNAGAKPKKDGYVFSGWTVNGGATTVTELTSAHIPSSPQTPIIVKAKWTASAYLEASDFVVSYEEALEIEDAQFYDEDGSGYAQSIVSLSALAGVQTAPGDPVVSADFNVMDYIQGKGEGCYYVEFTTSNGAFATVAMTMYKNSIGRSAALKATTFDLSSVTAAAVTGASVIANNFPVNLSQIVGGTNAAILANAKSYTWQRQGNIIKNRKEDLVTVDGFYEITRGGYHTIYFRSESEPSAVISRTVLVIDDIPLYTVTYQPGTHGTFAATSVSGIHYGDATPTLTAITGEEDWTFAGWSPSWSATVKGDINYVAQWTPSICIVSYYDEYGEFILSSSVPYGSQFYDRGGYEIPGYDNLGWNTKPDGTGTRYTSATPVTEDVKVYSVWSPKLYTISFNAQGATGGNPASVSAYFEKAIPSLPIPIRKGYRFEGWYENGSGAKLSAGSAYNYTHNIIVTAKWTLDSKPDSKPDDQSNVTSGSVDTEPVKNIGVPVKKLYIRKGKTITVPAVAYNKVKISAQLAWKTSNAKVATVNRSGRVKGVSQGKAKVTVKSLNGKSASFTVYVVKKAKAITKLKVTGVPRSRVLKKGKTVNLKIKITPADATITKIAFKSSKPSVLSVDKAGKLTAIKKGRATITINVGNKSQKIKIRIK